MDITTNPNYHNSVNPPRTGEGAFIYPVPLRALFRKGSYLTLDGTSGHFTVYLEYPLESKFALGLHQVLFKGITLGADTQPADRVWFVELKVGGDRIMKSLTSKTTAVLGCGFPITLQVKAGSQTMRQVFQPTLRLTNWDHIASSSVVEVTVRDVTGAVVTCTGCTIVLWVQDREQMETKEAGCQCHKK
jgi:hypothetical protein